MRKLVDSLGNGVKQLQILAFGTYRAVMSIRRGPVLWLVLSGGLLVAAIAIGTALVISEFREQALRNTELSSRIRYCFSPATSISSWRTATSSPAT